MLTGGASVTYAKGLAANKKNAIFLSGYQDAESPGRRLQGLSQGDKLTFADGTSVIVNCQVDRFKLSAHSDQGQLLSVIKQVNPKALALVHGEQNALSALHEKVSKSYSVSCPMNRHKIEGIDVTEKVSIEKVEAQITDTGIVLDEDMLSSKEWKDFTDGKHTAELKENQLIIRKLLE